MPARMRHIQYATLALLALLSFGVLHTAHAAGTAASTSVESRATVSYSVAGVSQTPIESSPAGNSTPGAGNGASTTFVVDNRIDLTVSELSGSASITSPGQGNAVTAFTLTNTGNSPQGYQLAAVNEAGSTAFGNVDDFDVSNLRVFVDSNGNGTYDAGVDTVSAVDTLAADAAVTVFIVADVPITAANGQFANVQLTARAAVPGTAGATLAVETTGADDPNIVDIVFGDAGNDALESMADQYAVQSAALSIVKTATVISDPVNGTTNPKAIPGAVVEYTAVVTNSGAVAANLVVVDDQVPANATYVAGSLALNSTSLTDAGDADAGEFVGGPPAHVVVNIGTVNTGGTNAATVVFRVTID